MYNKVHYDQFVSKKKTVLFVSYHLSTLKTEFPEYVRLSEYFDYPNDPRQHLIG